MFKIKFFFIFLLFIFCISCSKNIVEKSVTEKKDIELQMIEAYREGLIELEKR